MPEVNISRRRVNNGVHATTNAASNQGDGLGLLLLRRDEGQRDGHMPLLWGKLFKTGYCGY